MSWAERAAVPVRLFSGVVPVPSAFLLTTIISMLTVNCSPQGFMLYLAPTKKEEKGCFKFLWTPCLTNYWSHRERQRTVRLEICFAQPRDKKAHPTMCKQRPWPKRMHSSWESCSSSYRMASFLLSTETREMWLRYAFGVTFKHLLKNTVTDSGQGLLHISQESTIPVRKCLLPKCCKAPSAWSTPRLAWSWEPWATDPELMGRELQLWNSVGHWLANKRKIFHCLPDVHMPFYHT